MSTPTWVSGSLQNITVGGTPAGSTLTKTGGGGQTYDATARTVEQFTGPGYIDLSVHAAHNVEFGLWNAQTPANIQAYANRTVSLNVDSGSQYVTLRENGTYRTEFTQPLAQRNTWRIEVYDSGGGVYKARFYLNGVLQGAVSSAITLPIAFGVLIGDTGNDVTNIAATGFTASNQPPVVNAGPDQNVVTGSPANLNGTATDDGLPSGSTLSVTWSKVSGPGTVSFGNANQAVTTATFSANGTYVLRLTATDGTLTTTDDITIVVAPTPVQPVAPTSYDLRTDATIEALPAAPTVGAAGSSYVDPVYNTRVTRITDANTGIAGGSGVGSNWGTPSGPATNMISADEQWFIAVNDNGSNFQAWKFNPTTGVCTFDHEFTAGLEPTFSRVITKPDITYGSEQNNSLIIKSYNVRTKAWTTIYDLRTDSPELVAGGTSYMGAVYNSQSPERLVCAYGGQQDLFKYMVILNPDNPSQRVTIDTRLQRMKVNGGAWQTLLNYDGSTATLNVGLHGSNIGRDGVWAQLNIQGADGGAGHTAFFNMNTLRLHEVNNNQWWGHSSMGFNGSYINQNSFEGSDAPPQWLFTDLSQGGTFNVYRRLIYPKLLPQDWYFDDHSNWNNARADALVPIISETQRLQRGTGQTVGADDANWNALWEQIILLATAPGTTQGVNQWWRACHHQIGQVNGAGQYVGTFRDSARVQITPGGMWAFFTSNMRFTLGTHGSDVNSNGFNINHRRDLFLVRLARETVSSLVIGTTSLPGGTQGLSYSQQLSAGGGVQPYTWSVTVGALPTGLSLGASTGIISGTPTAAGTYNFTVRVQDSVGTQATQALSIVIAAATAVVTRADRYNFTWGALYVRDTEPGPSEQPKVGDLWFDKVASKLKVLKSAGPPTVWEEPGTGSAVTPNAGASAVQTIPLWLGTEQTQTPAAGGAEFVGTRKARVKADIENSTQIAVDLNLVDASAVAGCVLRIEYWDGAAWQQTGASTPIDGTSNQFREGVFATLVQGARGKDKIIRAYISTGNGTDPITICAVVVRFR